MKPGGTSGLVPLLGNEPETEMWLPLCMEVYHDVYHDLYHEYHAYHGGTCFVLFIMYHDILHNVIL